MNMAVKGDVMTTFQQIMYYVGLILSSGIIGALPVAIFTVIINHRDRRKPK
jgi:hypothetical protein